ncbi:MAG: hypothetical protein H6657_09315 [Ardenticatenaceae bacterium]|nr:hypothetical protein [Ardenticatenaceae bacterium]
MAKCIDSRNLELLIQGPMTLERGIFGMGGKLTIKPHTVGVIFEGGQYATTLGSGEHNLGRFRRGVELEAYIVATNRRILIYQSNGEFYIEEQGHGGSAVETINVELSITYEVEPQNARKVAVDVANPIEEVCNLISSELRDYIGRMTFDEYRLGGRQIIGNISDTLSKKVKTGIGITFLEINLVKMTGAEEITSARRQNYIKESETFNPVHLINKDPELAKIIIERMIDSGSTKDILQKVVENKLLDRGNTERPNQQREIKTTITEEENAAQSADSQELPAVPNAVVEREYGRLLNAGFDVDIEAGIGRLNLPDGSYTFINRVELRSEVQLEIRVLIPRGYSAEIPPIREVIVNDELLRDFPAISKERWKQHQDIVHIFREVHQYYT